MATTVIAMQFCYIRPTK